MQPKPAGEPRVADPVAPVEPAAPPGPDAALPQGIALAPPRPALVMRPQVAWRVLGPGLILAAIVLVAAGRLLAVPVAFVLAAIGAALLPAWFDRVEVGETAIVKRHWRGGRTVPIADIDGMGLRRLAWPAQRWLPRGYRFGRYWSIPLTLRLLAGDEVLLELRCVWWSSWREVARYIARTVPDLDVDGRTRGRLERYVGLFVAPPQR